MQIPESPPTTASERPGTALTEESGRNTSVSQDRTGTDAIVPAPVSQPEPTTMNGNSPEAQAGLVSNGISQVCSAPSKLSIIRNLLTIFVGPR